MGDQAADNQERFIEVVGGYDEDFGDPPTRRPLPADAVPTLRELKDCEQVRRYLINLPNTVMLQNYRHVQYRNLEDGSLHDFYGYGAFNVRWGGPERVEATQVVALPALALMSATESPPTEAGLPEWYTKDQPPTRTVGDLLRVLQQIPSDVRLQCYGMDFVRVTVCRIPGPPELFICGLEESRGPDAEPGAAADGGA